MSTTTNPRFGMPRVQRVQLHSFSLYSQEPDISLKLEKGVTCLAGANGIGKSTFLSTINFALTGAVPEPSREFLSAMAYFNKAKDYTKSFFDGRISETDRDSAAVTIEFTVRGWSFRLTRPLLELETISELHISKNGVEAVSAEATTAAQNETHYREAICEAVGLSSFEQFVVLQHILFTFDESRHLIFWDRAASSALLYICFGGDPQDAARADRLNRDMEKAGSRGRNIQFQASSLNKRIETLEQAVTSSDGTAEVETEAHYRELTQALSDAIVASDEADVAANDAELKVMEASSAVVALRSAYSSAFDEFMNGSTEPERHPLIATALAECRCPVCQTEGNLVAQAVRAKLDASTCPLCTSDLSGAKDMSAATAALTEKDKALAEGKRKLESTLESKVRLSKFAAECRERVKACRAALNAFEEGNRDTLEGMRGRLALLDGQLAETLIALRTARDDQYQQRDLAYAERDRLRDELRCLQRELQLKYAAAESEFVPRFKRLARAFLGIDLDISLVTGSGVGMNLQIEMRGNPRRKQTQLSESQRFFIDIALRMALAQYVSDEASPATLFIDTPEGSLDIAYEDRAGQMFADFVKSGHALIMTANINSSKLLTTLAKACGKKTMSIVQMTRWTDLSDVQQYAETLFRDAFAEIEASLNSSVDA